MALEKEIRAYERRREEMERLYLGKYVAFHDEEFVGSFDTLDDAANEVIARYGQGPYLIRRVGEEPDAVAAVHLAHLVARPTGAEH